MNEITSVFKKYWPSALTLAVILYATLTSDPLGDNNLPIIPHLDKLIHATMMGGLFGAIVFDKQRADKFEPVSKKFLLFLAGSIMLFSILDEIAQSYMEFGRSGDCLDLIADWSGVIVAFFTAPVAVRKVLGIRTQNNGRTKP